MSAAPGIHQFVGAGASQIADLRSMDCKLEVRQHPLVARVAVGKEKDRKPVDPPPIVQLKIPTSIDPHQNYLQSPYFFLSCSLVNETQLPHHAGGTLGTALAGTLVSSLHRLKDTSNSDGAFFVFGDLSVKVEGTFRLQFNLYQMQELDCIHISSVTSEAFPVLSAKNFTGMAESTFLTRTFSDQGVRLRVRKEPRSLLKKKGPADDDYEPRTYNKSSNRVPNKEVERQPIRSPDSRDSTGQNDQIEAMAAHSNSFEHRPGLTRHYTEQSASSYPAEPSYDGPPPKRPRTGSEQGQSSPFPHDTPHFSDRSFSDPHASYASYSTHIPHGSTYNYTNTNADFPSPAQNREIFGSAGSGGGGIREQQYFGIPKLQNQLSISPYDQQRSPSTTYFPPTYVPSIPQGQYSAPILPSTLGQRSQHHQNAISDLALARMQIPSPSGIHRQSIAPLSASRMPTYSMSLPTRDTFPAFDAGPLVNPFRPAASNPNEPPVDGYS